LFLTFYSEKIIVIISSYGTYLTGLIKQICLIGNRVNFPSSIILLKSTWRLSTLNCTQTKRSKGYQLEWLNKVRMSGKHYQIRMFRIPFVWYTVYISSH